MLTVETKAKIKRLHGREGKSIRCIARELKLSRNTVRKAVREGMDEGLRYVRKNQPLPQLGGHVKTLEDWLEAEGKLPRRCRRTAQGLYEDLCREGYSGAYDSVQRFVKRWRNRSTPPSQVFVPLSFDPGEAYQFDFSEEEVELAGAVTRIKVAQFRLCHSGMLFVVAYPCERLEMVLDAHNRAFAFFNGSPARGIYDNLKTCVSAVLKGKERRFNPRFLALMGHYLVEPVACTPASGWEKGQVENQVGNIREWLFTPRLRFDSLPALNAWLAQRCLQLAQSRPHPKLEGRTVAEVFRQEQAALKGVGAPFDGYAEEERRASSTSLVGFDRNHYSVDCAQAGRPVTVRAYAERLVIVAEGSVQAEHVRLFGRGKIAYDPWHYLKALERKPGALRNGEPFKGWALPKAIVGIREKLMRRSGGDREFVEILCAAQRDLDTVTVACELALEQDTPSAAVVLNLVHRLRQDPPTATVNTPEALRLKTPPQADLGRYDSLLSKKPGVGHAAA